MYKVNQIVQKNNKRTFWKIIQLLRGLYGIYVGAYEIIKLTWKRKNENFWKPEGNTKFERRR